MRFILIVEGHTEKSGVPGFLARWLNSSNRLSKRIGIDPINLAGGGEDLLDKVADKAKFYLSGPGRRSNTIAVIGMLDLYNPQFEPLFPSHAATANDRFKWGVELVEKKVKHQQFRMFFAVHEVEAWILSQPENLHISLSKPDLTKVEEPEKVNFIEPPSKFLMTRYRKANKRDYKKTVMGKELLGKLDPDVAYNKCPFLQCMLDEMRNLAQQAGL